MQFGEMAVDFVVGILTNGAGVHEQDIGAFSILGKLESRLAQ